MVAKKAGKTGGRKHSVKSTSRTPRKAKKATKASSKKRRETGAKLQKQIRGRGDALTETRTKSRRTAQAPSKPVARTPKTAPTHDAYERRNTRAKELGYKSYWDHRQGRLRARKALTDLGHPTPMGNDAETLKDLDQIATLGRGGSARDLYYETKTLLEKYQGAPSDRQIWSLIRIFYKPRGRR